MDHGHVRGSGLRGFEKVGQASACPWSFESSGSFAKWADTGAAEGNPGNPVVDYRPFNAAKLVKARSGITLNLHYTPNGTAVTSHVQIGLTVAKAVPERRYVSLIA